MQDIVAASNKAKTHHLRIKQQLFIVLPLSKNTQMKSLFANSYVKHQHSLYILNVGCDITPQILDRQDTQRVKKIAFPSEIRGSVCQK